MSNDDVKTSIGCLCLFMAIALPVFSAIYYNSLAVGIFLVFLILFGIAMIGNKPSR